MFRWSSGRAGRSRGCSARVPAVLFIGEHRRCCGAEGDRHWAVAGSAAEAMRLQVLRHPNVVSFFGMVLEGLTGKLVMEFCEGRDLRSVLDLRGADGQRLFGWHRLGGRALLDVARALNYLHSKGVVHMAGCKEQQRAAVRPRRRQAGRCGHQPAADPHLPVRPAHESARLTGWLQKCSTAATSAPARSTCAPRSARVAVQLPRADVGGVHRRTPAPRLAAARAGPTRVPPGSAGPDAAVWQPRAGCQAHRAAAAAAPQAHGGGPHRVAVVQKAQQAQQAFSAAVVAAGAPAPGAATMLACARQYQH
ncbi:hypothetical protein ABPG75_003686 [Micractinium tetrahymenae]